MQLWDLEIEKIPCGWEEIYQKAVINHPDGLVIDEIALSVSHPVEYRNQIINEFNKTKQTAISLMANQSTIPFPSLINKLVKLDARLFYLIIDWMQISYDETWFKLKNAIPTEAQSLEGYVNFSALNAQELKYAAMRLVQNIVE